jgi:hypothetical protein
MCSLSFDRLLIRATAQIRIVHLMAGYTSCPNLLLPKSPYVPRTLQLQIYRQNSLHFPFTLSSSSSSQYLISHLLFTLRVTIGNGEAT